MSITTTSTSKEQRTIPTTTKPTNKECQEYQRRRGRNNSTTTRKRRGSRINRPRTNNVYNRTQGRLEKDQSDREFKETKNFELNNMTPNGEIIIQTTLNKNNELNWLADTGSSRSFIDINTANELIQNNKNMSLESYKGQMKFKCFNNQDIPIIG